MVKIVEKYMEDLDTIPRFTREITADYSFIGYLVGDNKIVPGSTGLIFKHLELM